MDPVYKRLHNVPMQREKKKHEGLVERSVSLSTNKFSQMANDVTKRYELSNADVKFQSR